MYIQIKFPTTEKIYYFQTSDETYKSGDEILVDSGEIQEMAIILSISNNEPSEKDEIMIGEVKRKITPEDRERLERLKEKTKEYLPLCQDKIEIHGLDMRLIDADLSFDEKKLTFFFIAVGRIDFRELVMDLVRTFKKVIRLQQIGTRDEAKIFGGCGKCGRALCCSSFLTNIESITLDMAKEQDIISSSNKLSGSCGKLMCCLAFELKNYRELANKMPQIGEEVKVKNEKGRVVGRSLIKQTYFVETGKGQKMEVEL
ncbi:hypothetical protein A3F08_02845 [Candidatus Berkelbacteria bacterium RIFCSPHIGHO2_12_FULL_36_9]|uniref:PSP1 C-terminal domain-containing protein n=1 Tax=Candidatus Berkelbacteria bacterium RIFCSPHIGHO2_12_FULL_36_9 TaxID=1797469 RepID=A0A1F5EKU9_9BACT|nr:MAG: hypothetical protein A3F08_02845 [Candidatus Berkelbacteria bacterium RIFCSPHIGHO2_12_FULL_36_9]